MSSGKQQRQKNVISILIMFSAVLAYNLISEIRILAFGVSKALRTNFESNFEKLWARRGIFKFFFSNILHRLHINPKTHPWTLQWWIARSSWTRNFWQLAQVLEDSICFHCSAVILLMGHSFCRNRDWRKNTSFCRIAKNCWIQSSGSRRHLGSHLTNLSGW